MLPLIGNLNTIIGRSNASSLLLNLFDRDNVGGIVGGKLTHQLTAADRKMLLIERVKALPPFLSYHHQIRFLQDFEVMTYCRLIDLKLGIAELLH